MTNTEAQSAPKLITITDRQQRAAIMVPLFKQWDSNITVAIWGRAKATLTDKEKCPDRDGVGLAEYPGDCDNCNFFMGIKTGSVQGFWGEHAPACCAVLLQEAAQ